MTVHYDNVHYNKDMIYDYSQEGRNSTDNGNEDNEQTYDKFSDSYEARRNMSVKTYEDQQIINDPFGNIRMMIKIKCVTEQRQRRH